MLDIYNYTDICLLLNDHLEDTKKRNPSYSLRSWAAQLNMKSHGPLHEMLKGRRKVSKKLVPELIKSLKLKKKESKYFETLVDLQRSKSEKETLHYQERLMLISPNNKRAITDIEYYKSITDPYHIMISELTQLKDFKYDLLWIQKKLKVKLPIRDIRKIVERLIAVGILKEDNTKLVKTTKHLYTVKEIKSETIQEYHKTVSGLAISELPKQQLEEREFNAVALNIKESNIPKIKEEIREFIDHIIKEYEAKGETGDKLYQLNSQFFSLSN